MSKQGKSKPNDERAADAATLTSGAVRRSSRTRKRRLNLRALLVLGVLIVVAAPGIMAIKILRDQHGAKAFLAEGKKQLEEGKHARAIAYLNRYLEVVPDDLDAMELKSKVLADTAHDQSSAVDALKFHTQMMAVKPKDERWEQARRRMVVLNLKLGRYQSAHEIAKQLKGDDADVHLLRAQALEGVGIIEKNSAAIDEARQEYEKAEAKKPGNVEAAENLARIYRDHLENPAKALQVLDQAVLNTGAAPKKRHAAALLVRARHYAALDQIDKATADVEQAVRDDPDGLVPRLFAAELALQKGDTDTARTHIAAVDPALRNDLRVMSVQGQIQLAESRPEEAIQSWRTGLMQFGGNDASMSWQLARVLLDVGRVSEAEPLIEQYRRLVGGEEPDAKYQLLKALALLKTNQPEKAAPKLEALRYKVPKELEFYALYVLGQAYESIQDFVKARDAYREAAEKSPKWSLPWKALARLQVNPADVESTLQKALTLNPNNAELLVSQARALFVEELKKPADQRSLGEIERLLALALKAAPGSPEVALFQADLYAATRRPEEALALLKSASELSPRNSFLWLAQANVLTSMHRLGEAQGVLDQAIKVAGPQAIFYITRATVLISQAHISEAKRVLTEGLARLPKEQRFLLWKSLGEIYAGQKDYDNATKAYQQWVELQPMSPDPRIALFELAIARNDEAAIARAIEDVKKVAGERSYYGRRVQVENLLRGPLDPARDTKRMDEAQVLIREIEENHPQLSTGFLLEGHLQTVRKRYDEAIDAYRKAMERNAGLVALQPLVALLTAEKRDKDLEELRKQYPAFAADIEKVSTQQALRSGDKDRARALAEKAVAGDPQGLNTRRWAIEVLQALGDPKEAEAAARKFIEERPTEPTPWLLLLMVQVNNRNADAAADTVEKIRQNVKTDRPEVLWGQCYRVVGNLKRADECFKDATQRWPEDFNVLSAAVTFYEQIGRRDAVEEVLRTILSRDKTNAWATQKLALSLASHTADRAAWDEALALVGPEPRPNDAANEQIIRAAVYGQGPEPADLRKAIEILEGLLAELPDRLDLRAQAARLLLATGDTERARAHAAKAAEGDSAKPEAVLLYAGILLTLKDLPAAQKQLDRLTKIDPNGLPVVELTARLLAAQGKADEAGKLLEKAYDERASNPDGLLVCEQLIQILVSIKQLEAAERLALRAAEVGPRGRAILAELLAARGKTDDAAAQLDKVAKGGDPALAGGTALAIAASPAADPRWLSLADRYRSEADKAAGGKPTFQSLGQLAMQRHFEGNYKGEVETYRKMLDANPPNYLFLNNLAWTLSEELKEPEEALKMVAKAIEKVGKKPHILDTRGCIYTRMGKYEEAVADLEAAAKNLRDPAIYYHLARAYTKMGKAEEARKNRDRALKAGLDRASLQPSEKADWDPVMNQP